MEILVNALKKNNRNDDETENSEIDLNKKHENWKQVAPSVYNFLIHHTLDSSLSVDWCYKTYKKDGLTKQNAVIGTSLSNESGENENKIILLEVSIPDINKEDNSIYKKSKKIIEKEFSHKGDVNKIRFNPLKENIVATKSSLGCIFLFDIDKGECIKTFEGHEKEGYGLAWNQNLLLSGSYDNKVNLYDIQNSNPLISYTNHTDACEDVSWSKTNPSIFGSVGDDKKIILYDKRDYKIINTIKDSHEDNINSIDFNYLNDFSLITAGGCLINLWDLRNMNKVLMNFDFHQDEVLLSKFSPNHECLFASGSADKSIFFWDISQIGSPISVDDIQDGPPELMFCHQGHRSKINDLSWNPCIDLTLSSVEEEYSCVQLYQLKKEKLTFNECGIKLN